MSKESDFFLQQRIFFPEDKYKIRATAFLRGLTILIDCDNANDLISIFKKNNLKYSEDDFCTVKIILKDFKKLLSLHEQIDIIVDESLSTLRTILSNETLNDTLVTVLKEYDSYTVSWISSNNSRFIETLKPDLISVLIAAGVPFNTPNDTWKILQNDTDFPLKAGVALKDDSSFIKILPYSETALQQIDLNGVFKIKNNLYGVSMFARSSLAKCDSLILDDSITLSNIPSLESTINQTITSELLNNLFKTNSGRVIVCPDTSKLEAMKVIMETIDEGSLYPCLIVCQSENITSWFYFINNHYKFAPSLTDKYSKIRIVSYDYFIKSASIPTPFSVIFDNVNIILENNEDAESVVSRFRGAGDTYKIALMQELPESQLLLNSVLATVVPEEFDYGSDLNLRYPVNPEKNFRRHANYYINQFDVTANKEEYNEVITKVTHLPKIIKNTANALVKAQSEVEPDFERKFALSKISEIIEFGNGAVMSPKISECLDILQKNSKYYKNVYVVGLSENFIKYVSILSKGIAYEQSFKNVPLSLSAYTLDDFDFANISDNSLIISSVYFPQSDVALVHSKFKNVTVYNIHAPGTIDDKLAVMSLIKDSVDFKTNNYSSEELDWIFS